MKAKNEQKAKTRWLVMVYMVAKNVPGEAGPLTKEAHADIKEMKSAIPDPDPERPQKPIEPNDNVRVVYQLHTEDRNEREVLGSGVVKKLEGNETVVGDGTALSEFVNAAVACARRDWQFGEHPNDRSMLVMWGHAYRFGIGAAVAGSGSDAIDFDELADRFAGLQRKLMVPGGAKATLDILGFDTCDLATVEMAVQMRPFADFLLASQMGVPLPGWPYDDILKRLVRPFGDPMEPAELSSYIVRRFCQHYRAERRTVALSVLQLREADELALLVDNLARALALALDGDSAEVDLTQELFERAQTVPDKPFVDVATLCLHLSRSSSSEDVRRAALALGDFLVTPLKPAEQTEPTGTTPSRSDRGDDKPFVAECGRNACEAGGLQGISLYAPNVLRDTYDWLPANHWYEKFAFTKDKSIWYEVVRALALPQ